MTLFFAAFFGIYGGVHVYAFLKARQALGFGCASAQTLGTLKFQIGINYESTPVDQHSLTWINTFVHPDEECPLGDQIEIPTLRATMGVSDNMDIGAYWTTAPDANYGMIGGEFRYACPP